jgi:hypothetical protein
MHQQINQPFVAYPEDIANAPQTVPVAKPNELPKNLTKLANLVFGGFFIAAVVMAWYKKQADTFAGFFASFYAIFFGLILLSYELLGSCQNNAIQRNFGFMFKSTGRLMFLLFIAMFPMGLGAWGNVAGISMIFNAFLNYYLIYKFKN